MANRNLTPLERFLEKISYEPNTGCWLWTAALNSDGYAAFGFEGRTISGYLFAFLHWRGPVPEGAELDHTCRVRCCVNPFHLEPVPHRINCQRGEVGKHLRDRTHCPQGHEYNEKNTGRHPNGRRCRECDRLAAKAWRDAHPVTPKPPKTHCKSGHEFTEDNTIKRNGKRVCRACGRIAALRYYHSHKI